MIRVLFVDHTPVAGGAELVLIEHIRLLDRGRIEPHVACTDAVPQLVEGFADAGAKVHLIEMPRLREAGPRALLGFARAVRQLRAIIRRERISVVVSNTTRASYVATLAVPGTGVPLVWWIRDFFYPRAIYRLTRHVPRRIIHVSDALRRFYGDAERPTSLVWKVANDLYRKLEGLGPERIQAARTSYGFGERDVVVGFMSRLVPEKGAADVIEAVGRLVPEFPELRLLVVGDGPASRELRELGNRRLGQRGAFAGYQTDEALYYSAFDIFVMATRDYEAYPTSVVQAMMAGKPVIASDVGGNPEIVAHEKTGLLYPAGNVDALVTGIRRLLLDGALASRLAEAGRRQVMAENRGEQLARNGEALYEALASGAR
jgi:glycosyltransferase involved in cell wall biosynthesis